MGRYNTVKKEKTVTTHQGGTGYSWSDEIALIMILAAGLNEKYYQTEKQVLAQLRGLIDKVWDKDPKLVAQMLVYARAVLGQRSITHYASAYVASKLKGQHWGKLLYSKRARKENEGGVIFRLDDITEIAGAYQMINEQDKLKLSNAMKKGFAKAIEKADRYEIAKYKADNAAIKLVDIVNLVHPKSNGDLSKALKDLVKGTLKQENTRQAKNTDSGKKVAAAVASGEIKESEKEEVLRKEKAENYRELISSRRMGYMDLIRNLRNILNTDESLVKDIETLITDKKLIDQSKIFPHQIDLAMEVIKEDCSGQAARKVIALLDKAYELAIDNVKYLNMNGNTAVVIDTSGSMFSTWATLKINGRNTNRQPIEKAALIGATLGKGVNADMYQFSDMCKEIPFNPVDSINTIKHEVLRRQGEVGHGTYYSRIFEKLASVGRYERIFIISDGQGADSCKNALADYKRQYGFEPYIYFIDLCGYGTTSVKPGQRIYPLAGYSAAIYETAKTYEVDPQALLTEIKAINL